MRYRFLQRTAVGAVLGALGGLAALSAEGCTRQQARDAHQAVLSATDLACVMGSFIVDPVELQRYCRLADGLLSVIQNLIGFREAGRRAGVTWAPDAGAEAGP